MTGRSKLVKAKKEYQCVEHSYHRIEKGQLHLCQVMMPWHDMNQSGKYITYRVCVRCAKHYGQLNSDMRKQLGWEGEMGQDRVLSIMDGDRS